MRRKPPVRVPDGLEPVGRSRTLSPQATAWLYAWTIGLGPLAHKPSVYAQEVIDHIRELQNKIAKTDNTNAP